MSEFLCVVDGVAKPLVMHVRKPAEQSLPDVHRLARDANSVARHLAQNLDFTIVAADVSGGVRWIKHGTLQRGSRHHDRIV